MQSRFLSRTLSCLDLRNEFPLRCHSVSRHTCQAIREVDVDRGQSPTVGRLLLGIRLRELRTRAEITAEEAADHISRTDSTMSRMENGQTGISPRLITKLCDLYRVTDEEREELMLLARQSKRRGWWHSYGDVLPAGFEIYLGIEDAA